ncbi:sensor histidine kinase YpdA [Kordia sp. SMS9]|uniref:sensor histidine kinase n=1 Tax=Kordia sp. SMS9 TaxID=2282170 RepID=UPI000E102B12|nr:histidine kinase [Kordia sp. SMS9]AXG68910.1 sensor histidine kinase YpdA [Kordia sp. SMS9]
MSKTKLYILVLAHLLFWVLNYVYITTGNLTWMGFDNDSGSLAIVYNYGMFFNAFLCYIQVFWLVPAFFIKHKKVKFWTYSLLFLVGITFVESYLDTRVAIHYNLLDSAVSLPLVIFSVFVQNAFFHVLYSVFGFLYRFLFEYRKSERAKQELLKETHQTELKYLKAQLNPHFLFNGINSVYHLIGNNNALAKDTLLQFSGLLRYQLYESSEALIDLEKELDYVSQYIRLESIRKGDDISVTYTIDFENTSLKIAPLLLTPFIENAFKHISHHDEAKKNTIVITIEEAQQKVQLSVQNSTDQTLQQQSFGGVGLQNVHRRLALLYPEKHDLKITDEKDFYNVDLIIDLS